MDDFNREILAIEVDHSLPSERVIRVLDQVIEERGVPEKIRVDNGPEFTSHRLGHWAAELGIKMDYIKPGKPTQNAFIERFNRTYREDVLDMYLFRSLEDVREISSDWMTDYNHFRPHQALGGIPPRAWLNTT